MTLLMVADASCQYSAVNFAKTEIRLAEFYRQKVTKPTQRLDGGNMLNSSQVTIVDIKMPFMSMVVFMVKMSLAAIPAAIIVVVISMLIAIPSGYALARYRIPFGAFILFLFLMPNAFPQQPIFVNLLGIFTKFGLAGTVPGVILVHILVGLVFGVWITSATFRSIPPSMEEAARSVGASGLRAFFKITVPLAAPGLLASAVFVFITSLDEFTGTFFVGLPFVNTLPMTLYSSSGYNMQFASVIAIILLIPSILFMVLIQKVLKAEYVGGMG